MSTAPAETPTAAVIAESSRQTQLATRAAALSVVAQLWPTLNFNALDQTWTDWLARMSALLTRFHQQAAQDAALLYRGLRQLELGDPSTAVIASPPAEDWLRGALGYSGPGIYDAKMRAGLEQEAAIRAALASTLGASSRIVLDGARTTIFDSTEADPEPVRWYRVTDGSPCAFCALMASRGAVFRGADTAGDARKFHDDCGCTVAPSFTDSHALAGVALEASRVYDTVAKVPPADRLSAFRRAWRDR